MDYSWKKQNNSSTLDGSRNWSWSSLVVAITIEVNKAKYWIVVVYPMKGRDLERNIARDLVSPGFPKPWARAWPAALPMSYVKLSSKSLSWIMQQICKWMSDRTNAKRLLSAARGGGRARGGAAVVWQRATFLQQDASRVKQGWELGTKTTHFVTQTSCTKLCIFLGQELRGTSVPRRSTARDWKSTYRRGVWKLTFKQKLQSRPLVRSAVLSQENLTNIRKGEKFYNKTL